MLITKNNKNDAFVRRVDAESRVTVWAVNRANSPLISKLGLTHVLGGAVDASGQKILHATGPGVTLELHDSSMQLGQFGLQPQIQYFPANCPPAIPQFYSVSPQNLALAIRDLTGMLDLVSFAEKQNLFSRDMDKVSVPKLCRCFCDPDHWADGFNLACFNADGSFKARFVLFGYSVFEVKWFKYTDSPEKGYFLFAPKVSAVYAPLNCDGTFTTDANIACVNFTMDMGWICTAGGVENLDWEIIRRYEKNARLVCPVFPDDPLLTYNLFVEAFDIVTEARRHGIKMKIVRAKPATEANGIAVQAQETLLDSRKIKKVARRYHLPIDPVWYDLPGEINFDDGLPMRKVPPFWTHNRVAVFFGMRSDEFLVEIIRRRPRSAMLRGRPLVVVDEKDRKLADQVHAAGGNKISVVSFDVFQNKDVFLATVPSKAKMIFIVPPRDDSEMNVITPEILNVCVQAKLPVGIFSRSKDAPQQETASDTVLYCVAKSQSDGDSVFAVKNMETNIITNYKFSPAGVTENPGTENDMKEQM